VLLIIFMVITPMLQRGRDVPLPKTRHHEEKKDLGEQPIVSVATMQGKPAVFLGKERVPGNSTDEVMEELTHRASDELERKRAKGVTTVFVKADASIKYGDIYPVLIALQKAKSDGVELGVFELKEEK
jgi:biopolymer transport protein ExbD